MSPVHLIISANQDGSTVSAIVRAAIAGASWNKARSLCESGRVTVDGEAALDPAARVRAGSAVVIDATAPKRSSGVLPPEAIVYVDRDVVVVDKPAGLITVPFEPGEKDTLVDRTRAALRRTGRGYDPELGVVQRLDKDTTGLLVFARNVAAKKHLGQQLRVHSVERRYLAIVHGTLAHDRETFASDLLRDRGDGLRGSWGVFRRPRSPSPPPDAQHAVTHVRVLEALRGATLVECQLETGRQHQIRIHLAEAGHMLVGETVYVREHEGDAIWAPRPMLHALALGFLHPRSSEPVHFEREPPEDFDATYLKLRR